MNLSRRHLTAVLGASLLTLAHVPTLAQPAGAQAPLKLIVPFTPGTGIDLIARTATPAPRPWCAPLPTAARCW